MQRKIETELQEQFTVVLVCCVSREVAWASGMLVCLWCCARNYWLLFKAPGVCFLGCFFFCSCIIYTNDHLWPFLKYLPCVCQSLSHCERHSIHWNAQTKVDVTLQLPQFLWHCWRQAWGYFFQGGIWKKFIGLELEGDLVDGGERSQPSTDGGSQWWVLWSCTVTAWSFGSDTKHLACAPQRANTSPEALSNPDTVKCLVLDLPSAAVKGMSFFP